MKRNITGLFHNPWRPSYDPRQSVAELYRRAVWMKANPRSEEYMKTLFSESHPDAEYVNADRDAQWLDRIRDADTIVVLYPDAIGLYFEPLEHAIFRHKREWATVRALNGRRREFVLNARVRRSLRLRRMVERVMLLEAVAIMLFAVISPFFLMVDLMRGRR